MVALLSGGEASGALKGNEVRFLDSTRCCNSRWDDVRSYPYSRQPQNVTAPSGVGKTRLAEISQKTCRYALHWRLPRVMG